ncbi:MAG: hypothetical protein CMN30_32350 [Sandaracinus sp.]|nr:hypothetical protein [Sandaracinus sp.]MAQ19479.1 hypothetical protein [Sandaracinus sp.]
MLVNRVAIAASALLLACQGTIGGGGGPDPDPAVDMGPPGFAECGEAGAAILFFERTCAGCHQGSRFPNLSREGLAELSSQTSEIVPGARLLVPGDPEASFLYQKLAHTQGAEGGANMPLGRATPVSELSMIESWIRAGASLDCDDLAPAEVPYDPNTLDPGELFSCADPSAPRSSPSRVRRINAQEFTQVAVNGAGVSQNPLASPDGEYSTYAEGVGMDPATLNLLMMHLPAASAHWTEGDPGGRRMHGLHTCCLNRSGVIACMHDAAPTPECIDGWVDIVLTRGALFRQPSDDERSRLRTYVTDRIAEEPTSGAPREETLHEAAQAALLMTGSLFRSDLGDPETGELSDTELAFALGSVLGPAPVGTPIRQSAPDTDPDADMFAAGRYSGIAIAAADGTIRDPAVRRALLRRYASGVTEGSSTTTGSWWLAPRIRGFFREWLDFSDADSAFKDTPSATTDYQERLAGKGYATLQAPANNSGVHEPDIIQQLDATIARAVIESDAAGTDVFEALMTTRHWYIGSNMIAASDQMCATDADCPGTCDPYVGVCVGSTWQSWAGSNWVYDVTDAIATDEASRWVTLPADGPRRGVLTHPAWLGAHGGNFEDDASLVLRGHWLRTELFCEQVGGLDNVQGLQAMLVPSDPELSARERVRRSTEPGVDPEGDDATTSQCYGCHQSMNSLGFAFETFNHAGFARVEDHGGAPDGSTVIDNLPDPALNGSYATVTELVDAIAGSAYARRGMVRQAFRYFMGRDEVLADGCTLVEMEAALESTGSFFAMMEALVSSETFVRRSMTMEEGEDS